GARVYEMGRAIQEHAEARGLSVVRNCVGHGIAEELHTTPSVPHSFDARAEELHESRPTVTIEPTIRAGGREAERVWRDGGTAPGGTAVFVAADLGSEVACGDLVARAVSALGGLTVLVNNAAGGEGGDAAIGDVTTDAWEAIFRVNVTAPFWLCRAAIPEFLR